jgi:hypothetical protein
MYLGPSIHVSSGTNESLVWRSQVHILSRTLFMKMRFRILACTFVGISIVSFKKNLICCGKNDKSKLIYSYFLKRESAKDEKESI